MSCLFIIDIDGTIADAERRFKEAGPEPSRVDRETYDKWVASVQNEKSLLEDEPVPGMLELTVAISGLGFYQMVYLTSREDRWRSTTEKWLINNGFLSHKDELPLIMRPTGDYSEGEDFKEREINRLVKTYNIKNVVVIDDDGKDTIRPMCKKNGWTFLKACSGGVL